MNCIICQKPLDYEPEYCCNGQDCACRGEPIYPPVCSPECNDACIKYIGYDYDIRRQKAGIELWLPSTVCSGQ